MSEPASRVQRLLQTMSELPVPVDDAARQSQRRDQVVARLTRQLEDAQRAKRRRRWIPAVAALVAAALGLTAVTGTSVLRQRPGSVSASAVTPVPLARGRAVEGTVLLARGGTLQPVGVQIDSVLESGDELRTAAQSGATIAIATLAVVNMGPTTTLSIGSIHPDRPAGDNHVVLALGRIDVAVAKLSEGSSFTVRTPDAEVLVRGTRFSVTVSALAPGMPVTTSVQVTEGRVSVAHAGAEYQLERGDHWASPPGRLAEPSAAESASGAAPQPPARRDTRPGTNAAETGKAPAPSSLAEENRLFQAAMVAKRQGNDREAVSLLEQLIGKYPSSPLAPNARVERFRALRRLGEEAAAAREARRYLAENPDGFARDEARDAVLAPSPSSARSVP